MDNNDFLNKLKNGVKNSEESLKRENNPFSDLLNDYDKEWDTSDEIRYSNVCCTFP